MTEVVDQDILNVAGEYADAVAECRRVSEQAKQSKGTRAALGEQLLQLLEDSDVDLVKLPSGVTVKRYTAKSTERVTDEYVTTSFTVMSLTSTADSCVTI